MSLILVVEKDADFSNQLAVALRTEGHTIDAVASVEAGEQHATARSPQLVLVSGMLPRAPELLGRYSKRLGGPGSAVIVPAQMAAEISAQQFGADAVLPRPANAAALKTVLSLLPSSSPPVAPPLEDPALLPNVGAQLTSQQIFGDVLAEVEADAEKKARPGAGKPVAPAQPAPTSPPRPSTPAPAAPAPTAPAPAAPAPAVAQGRPAPPAGPAPSPSPASAVPHSAPAQPAQPRRRRANDDIDRKLEETLSGFFPEKLRAAEADRKKASKPGAKAPTKPRRSAPSADEIDDLLDKTLSSLELPRAAKRRRENAAPAAPQQAAPQPATPQPATPQPAAPQPAAPQPAAPQPAASQSPPSFGAPLPPPVSPTPPQPTMPSAAETIRLDGPISAPKTSEPPSQPALETPTSSSAPWTPDDAYSPDEEVLRTGTFDLPALEPLSEDAPAPPMPSVENPPSFDTPTSFDSPTSFADPSYQPTIELTPPSGLAPETDSAPEFSAPTSFAPEPAATPPPPTASGISAPAVPEPAVPEPAVPEPAIPEPAAAAPESSFDLPDLPAADGWSVSSFEEQPTPDPGPSSPPSLEPPGFDPAPTGDREALSGAASDVTPGPLPSPPEFGAPDFAPTSFAEPEPQAPTPPADEDPFAYPTDFESAFALPPGEDGDGEKRSGFSPDPTETVEPEDTASLQRTLEGVLQIRNGAAASSKAGIPFGDYRLLDRVAVGGMAEVWRAHRRGVEGFQKIVAIKKILSHLTGSQDFITMFIDEAKLAAQLNHANIIQIYDLGKVEDDFFIAMEFVDGKDLRSIQNRAKDRGEKLPLGLSLMVTAAVARALDYAHRKRDFDNRDLGLVHRDVSPQNVLISHEGEIKLCDFGIVKAVAKASSTQMGALKGKLQYMSPEQAWGKEVDARSDIFSLGSVFFELLTGERLFTGDSEIGVLDAVRDCRVRSPRSLEPDVPAEVEAIVMRALAATPETRYQTAGEMEKDIAAVLEKLRPAVGQNELAAMMARLFDRQESPQATPDPGVSLPPTPQASAPQEGGEPFAKEAEQTPSAEAVPAAPQASTPPAKTGGSRTWLIAVIALLALAAVVAALFFALRGGESTTNQTAPPNQALPAQPAQTIPAVPVETAPADASAETQGTEGAQDSPDGGESPSGDPDAQGEAQETGAPASQDPAPDGDAAAADGGAEGQPSTDVQQLIQDALDSERKKLEESFEAEKRRIEAELDKVRESGGEGGGDG